MQSKTDYYGRTICQKTCPAYFVDQDGGSACNANLRSYPDKWDGIHGKYIPLCRISKEFGLIKNE